MKGTGVKASIMDREHTSLPKEPSIQERGHLESTMVLALLNGRMAPSSKVSGRTVDNMALASLQELTALYMKEAGCKAGTTTRVGSQLLMARSTQATLLMATLTVDFICIFRLI
jgi:hypothetical protein